MRTSVDIDTAVQVLRAGGVVACPTETLVGMLADALSFDAVERVCVLKGRDPSSPMGVIVPSLDALAGIVAFIPERARELAMRHWPGPLTLVLRAHAHVHPALKRDGKIGVRIPGPSPALDLVRAFGAALTATSCNASGQPPALSSDEARAMFGNRLDGVIDGVSPGGLPSTVVDATGDSLIVIRKGAIDL